MSTNQIALKNLVSMEALSNEEVMALIKRGIEFKNGAKAHYDEQHIVANLFFESSTRTHKAFEVAELKLGCDLLDPHPDACDQPRRRGKAHCRPVGRAGAACQH